MNNSLSKPVPPRMLFVLDVFCIRHSMDEMWSQPKEQTEVTMNALLCRLYSAFCTTFMFPYFDTLSFSCVFCCSEAQFQRVLVRSQPTLVYIQVIAAFIHKVGQDHLKVEEAKKSVRLHFSNLLIIIFMMYSLRYSKSTIRNAKERT